MLQSALANQMAEIGFNCHQESATSLTVQTLNAEHRAEVLAFLAARPVHTVFIAGFIQDNGLVSHLNRGTFYACRDRRGRLEGVALIGHFTLVEARSERALAAFARLTQDCPAAHLILGERDQVERFWSYFDKTERKPRLVSRQVLFQQRVPVEPLEPVSGLREATADDLARILPLYALMVSQESGINPLEADPVGFQSRWLRRIKQRRVWLWTENDRLIFNAGILAETPDAIYLEGIHVDSEERGKGYGLRCLAQLSRRLLLRTKTLCLFVNEKNHRAAAFYQKAGFEVSSYYDTIFLHPKN